MTSAEGGLMLSGVGYEVFPPLSSRPGCLGERRELPQRAPRQRAPAENGFWRILKATGYFLYLYDKNLRGGTICISVPYSKFWGTCLPLPSVITPMIIVIIAGLIIGLIYTVLYPAV